MLQMSIPIWKIQAAFFGDLAVISDSSSTHPHPHQSKTSGPVRREVKGENFNVFIFHQADAQREFKERASVTERAEKTWWRLGRLEEEGGSSFLMGPTFWGWGGIKPCQKVYGDFDRFSLN